MTRRKPHDDIAAAINRVALLVSLALLLAMGVLWWRARTRTRETPRWTDARVVALAPGDPGTRERWIAVVNPECAHCRERLDSLAAATAGRAAGPALGVLLVDVDARPDSLAGAAAFAGGVWWDSAATWRRRWGRDAYGEVLVFAPGGALRRVLSPDSALAAARR